MKKSISSNVVAALLGVGLLTGAAAAHAQYGPPQGPPPSQYGPPQGPPPNYGGRGWDAPPSELRDVHRQGFLDGVQGAERDFQNHRAWNVNNRDEFRRPNVPGNVRRDYRDGFKRGYYVTVQHYNRGGPGRPGGPYGQR